MLVALLLVAAAGVLLPGVPAAEAAFDCQQSTFLPNTCIGDAQHRLKALVGVADAAACCAACSRVSACSAWTFWDGDKCNLFSTRGGVHDGDCVSGLGGAPPPAPSPSPPGPWTPPPPVDPRAICRDCPNIIMSLTDDQDILLGGWDPMRQTKALFQDVGGSVTRISGTSNVLCTPPLPPLTIIVFHKRRGRS